MIDRMHRLRSTMTHLQPGDTAPDFTLPDAHNAPVSLASLWAERPLVLSFLRHFG